MKLTLSQTHRSEMKSLLILSTRATARFRLQQHLKFKNKKKTNTYPGNEQYLNLRLLKAQSRSCHLDKEYIFLDPAFQTNTKHL
jgi:hypothetical protein